MMGKKSFLKLLPEDKLVSHSMGFIKGSLKTKRAKSIAGNHVLNKTSLATQ